MCAFNDCKFGAQPDAIPRQHPRLHPQPAAERTKSVLNGLRISGHRRPHRSPLQSHSLTVFLADLGLKGMAARHRSEHRMCCNMLNTSLSLSSIAQPSCKDETRRNCRGHAREKKGGGDGDRGPDWLFVEVDPLFLHVFHVPNATETQQLDCVF